MKWPITSSSASLQHPPSIWEESWIAHLKMMCGSISRWRRCLPRPFWILQCAGPEASLCQNTQKYRTAGPATRDIGTMDILFYFPLEHIVRWMNQANYIFNRHQITSEHQRYVYLKSVVFQLRFDRDPRDGPRGYLFLCPATDFQVGPWEFRWPRCPAYWSLDETGEERLSEEDACHLGFPAISCTTEIWGLSWLSSVYVVMASLQRSKGFDPYTQDVARHLKQPLFQLVPSDLQQFAHIDDEISDKIELKGDEGSDEGEVAEVAEQLPISCGAHRWTEMTQFGLILLNLLLLLYSIL
ncbi:hypothetical protein FB45DRAFT_230788 [Roridomyces roridus]|uniref:Uncharacterized protein n=1 Tax=Roridomyces roridus TaxID=1738132 RepID=A0AAD7BC98_9AGAR|nr:hypothetical protein FB45DRAFT_230788 [Roridomyces roridus]